MNLPGMTIQELFWPPPSCSRTFWHSGDINGPTTFVLLCHRSYSRPSYSQQWKGGWSKTLKFSPRKYIKNPYKWGWRVDSAICEVAVKQNFKVSRAQMFKKSAACYRQIHMCFGLNKHYNQYLSINQLLRPQLKIQRQGLQLQMNIPVIIWTVKEIIL